MIKWKISNACIPYEKAIQKMENHVESMVFSDEVSEKIWLLQHPSVYTLGTSGRLEHIFSKNLPVHATGRGGQVTYHGPGQRVGYVMLNLKKRQMDLRTYVHTLEEWVINALKNFDIHAERRLGRIGVWVQKQSETGAIIEAKIAAIGVRVRKGISFHGFSLNVFPDLSYYQGIIPCGLLDYGVTSCADLGVFLSLSDMDQVLQQTCPFEKKA